MLFCDTGTTGSAIAAKILEALTNYGLDLKYLRGQAYDGAGNMGNTMGLRLSFNPLIPMLCMCIVLLILLISVL